MKKVNMSLIKFKKRRKWWKEKKTDETGEQTDIHIVFRIVKTFVGDIYNGATTLTEADKDQSSLLIGIKSKIKTQNLTKKTKDKRYIKTYKNLKTYMHFLMVQKGFLVVLKAEYSQQRKLNVQVFQTFIILI